MTHMTLQAVRQLIANDSYAITFQSVEQYRATLLRHVDSLVDGAQQYASGGTVPAELRLLGEGFRPFSAPVAQQAAAPGALGADAHMTSYQQGYQAGIEMGKAMAADEAPSAPGTPGAPAEDHKGIALWQATMRACGELPEGYEVRIELENGCGMAVWYDDEGERHVIDGEGYLSDDVNEAVDAAIKRAAQLDGGQ